MTLDGTIGTLCEHSTFLDSIAIDEGGNLYVYSSNKGIITINTKGEIKEIPNTLFSDSSSSYGMAFNNKGDLFFTRYVSGELFMIQKTKLFSFSQSIPSSILPVMNENNNKGNIYFLFFKDENRNEK